MANVNVTTPASTVANAKLIDPAIKKYWYDEFSKLDPKLETIFKVSGLDGAYEEQSSWAGLGEVPQIDEGETYPEDAVLHTYDTTFTAKKWGVLLSVTEEMMQDDRAGIMGKTEATAKALARKIEKLGASVFNNGFSTSHTSYGDALPLLSTAHTRADAGTNQSNASTSGIAFGEVALNTAIQAMRTTLDDRGNLIQIIPNTLLVPPALEKTALIVTKSDKRSGSADNDANVYGMSEYTGGLMKVVVWDYLGAAAGGSDTAWFLLDSKQHEVAWRWRERPRTVKLDEAMGGKNDVWYWKARFRAAYGWSNWRGVWGSKGDAVAYAS